MRFLIGVLLVLGLAACATTTPGRLAAGADANLYALEGRFSLRHGERSYSGRISWEHGLQHDHVQIADPFGSGVAELDAVPGRARLLLADGRTAEDADADALLLKLTGMPLPIAGIGAWLTGRAARQAGDDADALGRTQALHRDGWQLRFDYAEEVADALPVRVFARRGDDLELRLSVERWGLEP